MIGENIIGCNSISTYEEAMSMLKMRVFEIANYLEDYCLKGKVISIRLRNKTNHDITLEKRIAISTRNVDTIMDVVEMLLRENCMNHWNGQFQDTYQSMSLIISQISYDSDERNTFEYNKSLMNSLISFAGMRQKLGLEKLKRSLG